MHGPVGVLCSWNELLGRTNATSNRGMNRIPRNHLADLIILQTMHVDLIRYCARYSSVPDLLRMSIPPEALPVMISRETAYKDRLIRYCGFNQPKYLDSPNDGSLPARHLIPHLHPKLLGRNVRERTFRRFHTVNLCSWLCRCTVSSGSRNSFPDSPYSSSN